VASRIIYERGTGRGAIRRLIFEIVYKLTTIVLDIAGHRPFKPVGIKKDEIDKRSFLKLSFANKGLGG
jgi:hypothetical protein